ncbi:GNAT family N-acetyltransferase [Pseudobutyrivibrio sp.]|jgi:phosphinothricin acetyltransferase|uniref:GNAT family N-acetyltransferase n=1 Tax=Pseudobutyrivibrio sp. TaxID=2014367 RepID=UPI002ED4287D
MNDFVIRKARIEDAERLVEIYSYYVLNTAVSFEYDVPSVEEFKERIRHTLEKYPYLVCMKEGSIMVMLMPELIVQERLIHGL